MMIENIFVRGVNGHKLPKSSRKSLGAYLTGVTFDDKLVPDDSVDLVLGIHEQFKYAYDGHKLSDLLCKNIDVCSGDMLVLENYRVAFDVDDDDRIFRASIPYAIRSWDEFANYGQLREFRLNARLAGESLVLPDPELLKLYDSYLADVGDPDDVAFSLYLVLHGFDA